MDVKKFIKMFREEVRKLYNDPIIGREKIKELKNYEHTYLIGIAIYNAVRAYNKESKNNNNFQKIFITPEERVLNGLRSDFSLKNEKDEVELAIEHEHDRRDKNHKKGINNNYKKLQAIDANEKLLICYLDNKDYDGDFKNYIVEKIKGDGKILLLIGTKKGDNDYSDSMKYKKTFCPQVGEGNASKD
ncbi:hypothetical protein HYW20_00360 [Candidatus Woesearchaeota archaeon]|nr:hypothetical protein [Candidatus Woesearchaeota archaeon]